MLRKFFFYLFFLFLLLFFAACGDDDSADDSDDDSDDDDSADDDDDDLTLPEDWRMELVDDGNGTGFSNSLALTSANNPITYYKQYDYATDIDRAKLAVKDGGGVGYRNVTLFRPGGKSAADH